MVHILVEDDPILRTVPVILDPGASVEHEQAIAEFYRHDEPDFFGWRERLRASIPGLFPAVVEFVTDQDDLLAKIDRADGAIVETLTIGAKELDRATKLSCVLKFGHLTRNIDRVECANRGVAVVLQRRRVNVAVAEHTFALVLALAKRIVELDGLVDEHSLLEAGCDLTPYDHRYTGNSNFARITGLTTLDGLNFGILGLGEIGQELAVMAKAFGMPVLYTQRRQLDAADEQSLNATYCTLEEMLERSDVVSVNVPLTSGTRGLIDAKALQYFKPGALLVNTARAEVVDRATLYEAIDSGRIGGLGLDVGYEEPTLANDPLLDRPNVILTPHVSIGNRYNALFDMEEMYGKLWRAITDGP